MPSTGLHSDTPQTFAIGCYDWLIVARGALPFGVVLLGCEEQQQTLACGGLVAAVWADVILSWVALRKGWRKQAGTVQVEGFVDFLAFLWGPTQFVLAFFHAPLLIPPALLFIGAGIYRLARFNTEGLVEGRYCGLPVTYNGYWFPLAALAVWYWSVLVPTWTFGILLLVLAVLMASRRLRITEF
jgi:phosphatidylserine synthase